MQNLKNTNNVYKIEGWKKITELSSKKESTTKIHEKMFQKKLIYLKTVMNDLMKLKETFRKLESQRKLISQASKKRTGEEQRVNQNPIKAIQNSQTLQIKQKECYKYITNYKQNLTYLIIQINSNGMNKWSRLDVIKNAIKSIKKDSHQKENKNSQEQSKDATQFKKSGLEKDLKEEDFTNNKSHFGYNDDEDPKEDEDNQEDEMNKTGFSFHNPMYQTQVSWKVD